MDAIAEAQPNVVFIETESPFSGIVIEKARGINDKIKFILVSNGEQLAPEQFNLHPSGWIIKPITEEKLRSQLLRTQYPLFCKIGLRKNVQLN